MNASRFVHPFVGLLVCTLLLPAVACGDQQSGWLTSPEISGSAQALPMDTVLSEYNSGITEPTRLLIDSSSEWENFWRTVYESGSTPERPAINFNENVVVAAGMGERRTGGYTIGIERVAKSADTLFAKMRESSPGKNCVVTQALTQPVQAVRVPVSDVKVLVTVEQDTTRDCG